MHYMWCVCIGWATLTWKTDMNPQPNLVWFKQKMSTNDNQYQPTLATIIHGMCVSTKRHSLMRCSISQGLHASAIACLNFLSDIWFVYVSKNWEMLVHFQQTMLDSSMQQQTRHAYIYWPIDYETSTNSRLYQLRLVHISHGVCA